MIGIMADSPCDIPQHLLEQHGIVVVSQVLVWGEQAVPWPRRHAAGRILSTPFNRSSTPAHFL